MDRRTETLPLIVSKKKRGRTRRFFFPLIILLSGLPLPSGIRSNLECGMNFLQQILCACFIGETTAIRRWRLRSIIGSSGTNKSVVPMPARTAEQSFYAKVGTSAWQMQLFNRSTIDAISRRSHLSAFHYFPAEVNDVIRGRRPFSSSVLR